MELKFRAWDKRMGKWTEPHHIAIDGDGKLMNAFAGEYIDALRYEVCQYIRLKDNNGKEIYEGDLVQTSYVTNKKKKYINRPIEVKRDQDGTGFSPFISGCGGCDRDEMKAIYDQKGYRFDDFGYYIVEVVGNIYEKRD